MQVDEPLLADAEEAGDLREARHDRLLDLLLRLGRVAERDVAVALDLAGDLDLRAQRLDLALELVLADRVLLGDLEDGRELRHHDRELVAGLAALALEVVGAGVVGGGAGLERLDELGLAADLRVERLLLEAGARLLGAAGAFLVDGARRVGGGKLRFKRELLLEQLRALVAEARELALHALDLLDEQPLGVGLRACIGTGTQRAERTLDLCDDAEHILLLRCRGLGLLLRRDRRSVFDRHRKIS